MWVAAGCVAVAGFAVRLPNAWRACAAFAAAGAWQLTRTKRIALTGCHRSAPLAPHGWRADRDCLQFGDLIGTRCIGRCSALMLASFAGGHSPGATDALTAIPTLNPTTP